MIEELQMILSTIGDLGEYAVWAVVAFFMWKLVTLASYLVFGKFIAGKIYNYWTKKLEDKTSSVNIGDMFITHDATPQIFIALVEEIRNLGTDIQSQYVHTVDVQKAIQIIRDYKESQ